MESKVSIFGLGVGVGVAVAASAVLLNKALKSEEGPKATTKTETEGIPVVEEKKHQVWSAILGDIGGTNLRLYLQEINSDPAFKL